MRYVSTRSGAGPVTIGSAMRAGTAPDGGLYLPEKIPAVAPDPGSPLPRFAAELLAPFFEGDPLAEALPAICAQAFDFPLPIVTPDPARPTLRTLELFHGPTGAFKDFGARFLAACFARMDTPLTILVATSGDTGGAVGAATEDRENLRTLILYPKGRVSPFQALQLGCWRSPVETLEVAGDFDDCQRLVKAAFADRELSARHRLTSANSINIGRLLPQIAYLGWAAAQVHAETGRTPGLVVPTGNLGQGFAALYARALGLPLGPITFVTNANRTLGDWARTGLYKPRPAVATIANAMDIGAPSNFERLAALGAALGELEVERVEDEEIRARIVQECRASGYVWCPHSAIAAEAFARLPLRAQNERPWLVCATADPFKFAETVEPLVGRALEPSSALAAIMGREQRTRSVPATFTALTNILDRVQMERNAA